MPPPSLEEFLRSYGTPAPDTPGTIGGYASPRMRTPEQAEQFGYPSRPITTAADPAQRQQSTAYTEGDEWSSFVGLAPEIVSHWQRKMSAAGLLQGEFRVGRWDGPTAEAMGTAMAYGNAWGTDYGTAIDRLATAPVSEDPAKVVAPQAYVQPSYQAPTPEMLAQEVKGFVRDRLGREPDDVDMDTLTSALARLHRRDYESQVEAERFDFERQAQAQADYSTAEGEATPEVGEPGEFAASGPDAVAAAFAEEFEELYAPETARNRRVEQGAENEAGFMASILASDRAIGAL